MFKNLFQQFQRAANVYFLVIGCLQLDVFFPGLSPTHWSTTIGPLLVVLSINAAKEAVDDYGRHKSDAEVNALTAECFEMALLELSPDGRLAPLRSGSLNAYTGASAVSTALSHSTRNEASINGDMGGMLPIL